MLSKIFWAVLGSCLPRYMEKSGVAPVEKRLVKAMTMEIIGKERPSPVSARFDVSER